MTVRRKTDWRTPPLGKLVERWAPGDVNVLSELSRLASSTLQFLEIGKKCITRGAHLHVAKNWTSPDLVDIKQCPIGDCSRIP